MFNKIDTQLQVRSSSGLAIAIERKLMMDSIYQLG